MILPYQLRLYGSATMPLENTQTDIGGAIDLSTLIGFNDISENTTLKVLNNGNNTGYVRVYGRNPAGVKINAQVDLAGAVIPLTSIPAWKNILKVQASSDNYGIAVVPTTPSVVGLTVTATEDSGYTVTLDGDDISSVDNAYRGYIFYITSGIGAGSMGMVITYEGSTKRARVTTGLEAFDETTTIDLYSAGTMMAGNTTLVRRPFYSAVADVPGGADRTYYEKVFYRNDHPTDILSFAQVQELADPYEIVDFALETTLDGIGKNNNQTRLFPPSGLTFNSSTKSVPSGSLGPEQAIGVWLKLTLRAGYPPANFQYALRLIGDTT